MTRFLLLDPHPTPLSSLIEQFARPKPADTVLGIPITPLRSVPEDEVWLVSKEPPSGFKLKIEFVETSEGRLLREWFERLSLEEQRALYRRTFG